MKIALVLITLFTTTLAFAGEGKLDGRSYCRTVNSNGEFGQPAGPRKHCLVFANGGAIDYANTFFGNPPDYNPYTVEGDKVVFGTSIYILSPRKTKLTTVKGPTIPGIEFTLEKKN